MKRVAMSATLAALVLAGFPASAVAQKKPPYWASITASKARMRTGPGRNYPATWLYQRAGLPVKVIETYPNWRKVEDPDGTQGWMQANLLTEERNAMVRGEIRALRVAPQPGAKINWRAEPGVIGKLGDCENGWCHLDVKGRAGFIEAGAIWGVDPGEGR